MALDYIHACVVFAIYMVFLLASQCYNIVRILRRRNVEGQFIEDERIPDEYSVEFGSEWSVINSPAVSQFKKGEGEHVPVNGDCAICLGEFEQGEWLKLLPNCSHGFHVSCIDTWFRSHSNCPICRSCVSHDTECSVSLYTLLNTVRRETETESIPCEFPQTTIAHDSCPH